MSVSYDDVFGREPHVEEQAGDLMRLAKGQLDGQARHALEGHLETCPACRLALIHMRQAVLDEQSAWERGRALVKDFVARILPGEAPHVDALWLFLQSKELLGTLPVSEAEPNAQMAFSSPIGASELPTVLLVFSAVLHGVIAEALPPAEAVDRVRDRAEPLLAAHGLARIGGADTLGELQLLLERQPVNRSER